MKLKQYISLFILIAFSSEIYFYPFNSNLKFSIGVIVLDLFILIIEDISKTTLIFLCGTGVFLIRVFINTFFTTQNLHQILLLNFPSLVYYISFGLLMLIVNIKNIKNNFFKTIIVFALIDSLSNVVEEVLRNGINIDIFKVIILAGFIRSFIAYLIYLSYNRQKLYIMSSEHQKRYTQLNLLIANVQSEMFYLKKSMKEIEIIMSQSYNLYEINKNNENLKEKTLNIAREVHEVKKDYSRVIKGFDSFIKELETEENMRLSTILTIIKDNTDHILKGTQKRIAIEFKYETDYIIKPYYSLFAIINNLIVNAIDACKDGDMIKIAIKQADKKDTIHFEISDTGGGIDEDIIPYIFNPGFTTKYDQISGKPSTGIGLCHVKNIIDELGGDIEVRSEIQVGTTFIFEIPKKQLEEV
jgi:two-component system, sensor histidine kinase YcbA